MGLSFASGEFADNVPVDDYKGMNPTGYSFTEEAGYLFNENFGLNLLVVGNSYSVKESEGVSGWVFDSFLICPVVLFPLAAKVHAGLEPGIGFATASLANENEFLMNGAGLGLKFSGIIVYDYAKRWAASGKAGYLYSKQRFKEGGSGKAASFDLQLGLAYKFGNKSL